MKMKKCFITALLGLLAVPTVLFAETPAEVQAWYDAEVRKAEANLADAEALAKANPNSPSMQLGAQRMRQNHANLLMMLQREYQRRMQQAQQGNSAGGAILPPVYAPGAGVVQHQGNSKSAESRQPLPPTATATSKAEMVIDWDDEPHEEVETVDESESIETHIAQVYTDMIKNYRIILATLRKIKDNRTAELYMPWRHIEGDESSRFQNAYNDIDYLLSVEMNLKEAYTPAVVEKVGQPYLVEIQKLHKAIEAEVKRIIAFKFYRSGGCENFIRSKYNYKGPITGYEQLPIFPSFDDVQIPPPSIKDIPLPL